MMEKYDLKKRKDWNDYCSVHMWIFNNFGSAEKCEECGSKRAMMWHNKSGEYKREISDWEQLCARCHSKFHSKKD